MSTTGNTTKNDFVHSGRAWTTGQKVGIESAGFLAAEMASAATGIGVIAIADQIIPKSALKAASQAVGKVVVEPFLDIIETGLSKFCRLEECKVDITKSREERAEALGRTLILFGTAYAASMVVKLGTRRLINHHWEVGNEHYTHPQLPKNASVWSQIKHKALLRDWSQEEKLIVALDEGVHLGSLFLLNNTLAPVTDNMIRSTTKVIQKVTGTDEKKAHEIATMAWVWEASNILGAASGIAGIIGKHAGGWRWPSSLEAKYVGKGAATHVERLAQETALNNTLLPPHP